MLNIGNIPKKVRNFVCVNIFQPGYFFIPIFSVIYILLSWNFIFILFFLCALPIHEYICNEFLTDEFQNSVIYRNYCEYFDAKIINKPHLNDSKKNIISIFPHGFLSLGLHICGGLATEGIKCIASLFFYLPFLSEYIYRIGCRPCDGKTVKKMMENNENIYIVPGAFNELYMMKKYQYNIHVPKGFIKLCIDHEYTIYPCFSFGENESYSTINFPEKYWDSLKKITRYVKLPFLIVYSRMIILPNKVPIWTVYGNPIKCTKYSKIDDIHKDVCDELKIVYDKYIGEYCKENGLNVEKYSLRLFN
jgi:2-acylglycerol O-acyltransferase 2